MNSPLNIHVRNFADSSHEITFEQFTEGNPKDIFIKVLSAQTEILEHVVSFCQYYKNHTFGLDL